MSVFADWGANGQSPSSVATSGTSAVYFPRVQFQALSNGQAGGPTGFPGLQAPATPTSTSAVGQLILQGSQYAPASVGQRLRMVAAGTATVIGSDTYTVVVQLNTGTAATPAYTTFATGAGAPTVAGTFPWFLDAEFVVGSAAAAPTDPNIAGFYKGAMGIVTGTTLVDLTVIPDTTNAAVMGVSGLVVNIAFTTGGAGSKATLNEFCILGD